LSIKMIAFQQVNTNLVPSCRHFYSYMILIYFIQRGLFMEIRQYPMLSRTVHRWACITM